MPLHENSGSVARGAATLPSHPALATLHGGFRSRPLSYDELTAQLDAWVAAFPHLARKESLGRTPEGRELWLLTLGRDLDRPRPAAWVDGNMHAAELAGSSVALTIAEEVLALHLEPHVAGAAQGRAGPLEAHLAARVRDDVVFRILPRISPDGAERVLTTGQYVRSVPRDGRLGRTGPRWKQVDLDGDGHVRSMRVRDPGGAYVEDPSAPGLMLPRRLDDPPPYYSVYSEGVIEGFDGVTVPRDEIFADTETDLNRNFPYGWAPEPRQLGAGPYATSEPEARAVTEFATRHPEIFFWLNLHTFGGVYIRPAGDRSDRDMNQGDLGIFHAFESFAHTITGYPVVSGFEEFTYEPGKPLCGDLTSFAYAQRGAIALVCELWDFFAEVGLSPLRPFVHNYQRRTRDDARRMAAWDRAHNEGRIVGGWRPFRHPQLGDVELGGPEPLFGVWNPPNGRLAEICARQAAVTLRAAAMAPALRAEARATPLGPNTWEVVLDVRNEGYLSTTFLPSAAGLPFIDPLRAYPVPGAGVELVEPAEQAARTLGQLAGWGGHDTVTPIFTRTTSPAGVARARWVVRGEGELTLAVRSARMGELRVRCALGGP